MKNLLFISSYPFPLNKGSNQHAYFLMKALTIHYNVYCIFFVQPGSTTDILDKRKLIELGIQKYKICYFKPDKRRNKYIDRLSGIADFPYKYMKRATHQRGSFIINNYIRDYSIEIVHFEHFHYTKYAFQIHSKIKIVVVYLDLYHMIDLGKIQFEKSYLNKVELLIAGIKKYIFQRMLEYRIDLKIFLNPIEMQALPVNSFYIPHIVNPEISYTKPRKNPRYFNLLFLGTYNHHPNRISLNYLIKEIVPLLSKKTEKFRIWIVGVGTEKYTEIINKSDFSGYVRIKGFVQNINDVFKDMDIALFPILSGGGMKTKVIESMAAGLPIVTTPQGVYGMNNLPRNCVEVGSTPDEIVNSLSLLFRNYQLRMNKSFQAKEYIEKEHSVENMTHEVIRAYKRLW